MKIFFIFILYCIYEHWWQKLFGTIHIKGIVLIKFLEFFHFIYVNFIDWLNLKLEIRKLSQIFYYILRNQITKYLIQILVKMSTFSIFDKI